MLTTVLLAATALAAGLTGTWSPCGFSMLSTLGPTGHTGGRPTTVAACATFAAGALAGGVATFLTLALLGRALGAGSPAAAVAIALAAAAGEARGVRVLPQVRRQVPEHWRRVMPLPLAGGLYGVLLGLGFTTFVLTLAVWALAGVCVALGDPVAGLAVGLAFGAGRALPVVVLAPWIDTARGVRCAELMAERPGVLRSLRLVDGGLLLAVAVTVALGGAGGAVSAARVPAPASPSSVGRVSPAASARAAPARIGAGGGGPWAVRLLPVASRRVAAASAATPPRPVVPLVSVRRAPSAAGRNPAPLRPRGSAAVVAGGSAALSVDRAGRLPTVFGGGSARSAGQPTLVAAGATDPTLGGGALAWTAEPGGGGELLGAPGGAPQALAGGDPALGGPYLAVAAGGQVTVTDGGAPVGRLPIPGVDALAVSAGWLVARAPDAAGRTLLFAYPLPGLGPAMLVAAEPSGTDISRPALDGAGSSRRSTARPAAGSSSSTSPAGTTRCSAGRAAASCSTLPCSATGWSTSGRPTATSGSWSDRRRPRPAPRSCCGSAPGPPATRATSRATPPSAARPAGAPSRSPAGRRRSSGRRRSPRPGPTSPS
jgi:hypothetical protein